jgi:hypothetical protein
VEKPHWRASAEAKMKYSRALQLSVPLGQSAGVRGQRYESFLIIERKTVKSL